MTYLFRIFKIDFQTVYSLPVDKSALHIENPFVQKDLVDHVDQVEDPYESPVWSDSEIQSLGMGEGGTWQKEGKEWHLI